MNDTNDREQLTKATYQKWYDRCHEVLAQDQRHRYEHPSREIRLEMMRVPSLQEAKSEQEPAPSIAVTLELFWNDPLLGVHLGMWTRNPAGMAMLFAGLELMDAAVDVS